MSSFTALNHWMTGSVPETPAEQSRHRALDAFLGDMERRAYVMAEMATRDPDEALDLVQDAMFAFARRYADKPRAEWAPLFHRVLQNRIRDWARQQKVRNRWRSWLHRGDDSAEEPLEQAPDPAIPPIEQQLDHLEATERLQRAVSELPLRQQQAFLLRLWEGLDVAQTAQAMGCSQGSVKTHLSRALGNLRSRLEGYHP